MHSNDENGAETALELLKQALPILVRCNRSHDLLGEIVGFSTSTRSDRLAPIIEYPKGSGWVWSTPGKACEQMSHDLKLRETRKAKNWHPKRVTYNVYKELQFMTARGDWNLLEVMLPPGLSDDSPSSLLSKSQMPAANSSSKLPSLDGQRTEITRGPQSLLKAAEA